MPSIVQSLVLVYSRLIIKYPNEIISFLSQVSIENRAGLKVLIDKWLLHLPRFSGKYYKNISLKALTLMYTIKNELIETLMVIGYNPSHSTASVGNSF
jgi:importin-9